MNRIDVGNFKYKNVGSIVNVVKSFTESLEGLLNGGLMYYVVWIWL